MKERHIKLQLAQSSAGVEVRFAALGWNMVDRVADLGLQQDSLVDVAYCLRYNEHPEYGGFELQIDRSATVNALSSNLVSQSICQISRGLFSARHRSPDTSPHSERWYTPAMSRGFFLTFEGLDGSGKSTQIKKLARSLQAAGESFVLTRQPGGTALGDRIRTLLLDSRAESPAAYAELALMFADRAQCIDQVILPALAEGKIVVCDRFTDSTEAYQGGGRNLGSGIVHSLHQTLCNDLQPDLTILLLPPLRLSLSRARRRNDRVLATTGNDENRFEQLDEAFFKRVYNVYRTIADRDKMRVVAITDDAGVEIIASIILKLVTEKLCSFRAASS